MNAPNHTDLYRGLGEVEGRLGTMEKRLDKIDAALDRIDQRLAGIEAAESHRKGALAALVTVGGIIGAAISALFQHYWK